MEFANPEDWLAIHEITKKHEETEVARLTEELWRKLPGAFRAIRDQEGKPEGYYIVFDPRTVPEQAFLFDPIMKNWWRHMKDNPIPEGQRVLFLRR